MSAAWSASSIREFEGLIGEIVAKLDAGNQRGGRPRRHPAEDPRLRPRQGAELESAKAEEADLLAQVPRRSAAAADCGGVNGSTIVIPDERSEIRDRFQI